GRVRERTGQLEKAKRELESTFDAIAEPIAIVEDFTIRRANMEFASRSGTMITSVPGRRCYELLAQREEPCVGCPLVRGDLSPNDVAIGQKTYRVSHFPVRGTNARVMHYRDVTGARAL